MKYSIEKIDGNSEFLFFWGHQPSKDDSITKSCLSQWWQSSFIVDEIEYKTAEHWMMAQKAKLFKDQETFDKIIETQEPKAVKALGRSVKNYDNVLWEKSSFEIVKEGNFHKFSQNDDLKRFLVSTDPKVIVEASPNDHIWGIGLDENNPEAENPKSWKGKNLLGFALMEVRDKLKEIQKLYYIDLLD